MPPPRVFDIISSHSNFNPNSNSKLNSKIKNKKVFLFFVGLHLAANIPNNVSLFLGTKSHVMDSYASVCTGVLRPGINI